MHGREVEHAEGGQEFGREVEGDTLGGTLDADARAEFTQGITQAFEVLTSALGRDVEIEGRHIRSVHHRRHPADHDEVDAMALEDLERLERVKGHVVRARGVH